MFALSILFFFFLPILVLFLKITIKRQKQLPKLDFIHLKLAENKNKKDMISRLQFSFKPSPWSAVLCPRQLLYTDALFALLFISKNAIATEVTNLLGTYTAGYRARKMFSEPKTHWNCTEMEKIWHTNTGKISRRQGKLFLFNLCPLFSTPKHVREFPYKPL